MLPDPSFWLVPELYEHVARRSEQHTHLGNIHIPGLLNMGMQEHGTWVQWQLLQWLRPCFPWPGPITSEAGHWVGFGFGRENTSWLRFVNVDHPVDDTQKVQLVLHSRTELTLDTEYASRVERLSRHLETDAGFYWQIRCDMQWVEIARWWRLFQPAVGAEVRAEGPA